MIIEASRRQGAQVLGLQVVDVALAAGAGEDLDLGRQGVEEVGDPLGGRRRFPAAPSARDPAS